MTDLITLAVPFFLIAVAIEIAVDRRRRAGLVPWQDALGSLGAGALSTTTGIFTKIVAIAVYGVVLEHAAFVRMPEQWFDLSPGGLMAWAGVLLLWDFSYYWKHRLGHEVALLWAAHSVHHQSEEYNLTTALRQTSTDFLVGWIVYVPMFLIGVPLHVFATVAALDLIYQFWVHTRLIGTLGWADRVFVTPANHRVHHAQNDPYLDKNYGGILIIWDRLFGTYAEEQPGEPPVYGVRRALGSFGPFEANWAVYRDLIADSRRTQRWRDKLGVWLRHPSWRPDDVATTFPRAYADPAHFRRYEVALPARTRRYLIGQFGAAMLLTLLIGAVSTSIGWQPLLALCVVLWLLLAAIGLASDGSANAAIFETLRLVLTLPLVDFVARDVAPAQRGLLLLLALVYVLASLIAVWRRGAIARPLMGASPG